MDETCLPVIQRSRVQLIMSYWKVSAQGISPRPETITETRTNRLYEQLIQVVFEECPKDVDFYGCMNLKQICVVSNSFEGNWIQHFVRRWARKRMSCLGLLSSGRRQHHAFLPKIVPEVLQLKSMHITFLRSNIPFLRDQICGSSCRDGGICILHLSSCRYLH